MVRKSLFPLLLPIRLLLLGVCLLAFELVLVFLLFNFKIVFMFKICVFCLLFVETMSSVCLLSGLFPFLCYIFKILWNVVVVADLGKVG